MPFVLRCRWLRTLPTSPPHSPHKMQFNLKAIYKYQSSPWFCAVLCVCVSRLAFGSNRPEDRMTLLACLFYTFRLLSANVSVPPHQIDSVLIRCEVPRPPERPWWKTLSSTNLFAIIIIARSAKKNAAIRERARKQKSERDNKNVVTFTQRALTGNIGGNINDNNRYKITFRHFSCLNRNSLRSIYAIIKFFLESRHFIEQIETSSMLSVPSKCLPFHYIVSFLLSESSKKQIENDVRQWHQLNCDFFSDCRQQCQ